MPATGNTITGSFGLDISPLRAAANQATGIVSRMGSGMVSAIRSPLLHISTLLGSALGGAVWVRGITNSIKMAGELYNLGKSSGVAVGELYKLVGVFAESDKSSQDAASALARMNKAVSEARSGTKTAVDAFAALHLNLAALSRLTPALQFQAIAQAIIRIPNAADKARLSMDIFGKSGASLIPVFEDVAKANLKALGGTAAVLQRNAALFDDVGDKFEQLKRNAQGLFVGVSSELLKSLNAALDQANTADFTTLGQKIGKQMADGLLSAFNLGKLLSEAASGKNPEASKRVEASKSDLFKSGLNIVAGAGLHTIADIAKFGGFGGIGLIPGVSDSIRKKGDEAFADADALRTGAVKKLTSAPIDRDSPAQSLNATALTLASRFGNPGAAINPFGAGALASPFGSLGALTQTQREKDRTARDFFGFKDASGAIGNAVPEATDMLAELKKISAALK